jgi:ABC-type nickel/cobalt efflux system permease component RcnA
MEDSPRNSERDVVKQHSEAGTADAKRCEGTVESVSDNHTHAYSSIHGHMHPVAYIPESERKENAIDYWKELKLAAFMFLVICILLVLCTGTLLVLIWLERSLLQ